MDKALTYYADLHIHSLYSKGSSPRMTLREIELIAAQKGISVMGTGDCFHPIWKNRIQSGLEEDFDTGLLMYNHTNSDVKFLPTVEVSCEWERKRVHMLLLFKDMNVAGKIRFKLKKYGDLESDGRPALKLKVSQLIDIVKEDFEEALVVYAHLLHPWFGAMGDKNNFESIYDVCDVLPDAAETGISADVKMIFSIGEMGGMDIVSFSDAHSPESIGREVTEFYGKPSWKSIRDGIIKKDTETIEQPPPLGRHYFSGHKKCGYSTGVDGDPICPKCHKRITIGVVQRVDDLICTEVHLKERYMVPLKKLIQLREDGKASDEVVDKIYNLMLSQGKEIDLLVKKDWVKIKSYLGLESLVRLVRDQQMCIIPGYDGKNGVLVNMWRLLISKMDTAEQLFQSKGDHAEAWGQAEIIQELMKSGAMTVTQAEYEELLQRRMPEPV